MLDDTKQITVDSEVRSMTGVEDPEFSTAIKDGAKVRKCQLPNGTSVLMYKAKQTKGKTHLNISLQDRILQESSSGQILRQASFSLTCAADNPTEEQATVKLLFGLFGSMTESEVLRILFGER